jgi:hypothetical protein
MAKPSENQQDLQLTGADPVFAGKVECLGLTFEDDEARRQYFTERQREKLKDPAFREQDGFPQGTDEDILRMSDPPFYTVRTRSSTTSSGANTMRARAQRDAGWSNGRDRRLSA